MEFTRFQILAALGTGIGAFGGFPNPPKVFVQLTQNELVKWLLLFVLIWQGGGGGGAFTSQAFNLSMYVTVLMYLLVKVLDKYFVQSE